MICDYATSREIASRFLFLNSQKLLRISITVSQNIESALTWKSKIRPTGAIRRAVSMDRRLANFGHQFNQNPTEFAYPVGLAPDRQVEPLHASVALRGLGRQPHFLLPLSQ